MKYFTHVELADKYHVSEATVRNWVRTARQGKLDLELRQVSGRWYIADVLTNTAAIERLVKANRKYRNRRSLKTVTPKRAFYETFSKDQIYAIIRSLEAYHEIPRQYNYFDDGADEWDAYIQHLAVQPGSSLLSGTIWLLSEAGDYLDELLSKYDHVNVVDVGPGNAFPVEALLEHLVKQKKLKRYIAIDISSQMLKIAARNVDKWFGDKIAVEQYQLDITRESFAHVLASDYLKEDARKACNLVLFLGGTAHNFRSPDDAFRTIHESMNADDLLIHSEKLESENTRPEWLNHDMRSGKLTITKRHRLVFDLLDIDDSLYDVETGYDERTREHYTRVRLRVALTLRFRFAEGERTVAFEKGDTILLWRSWQATDQSFTDQFTRNDFYVLHTSQTNDHQYALVIAQIRSE